LAIPTSRSDAGCILIQAHCGPTPPHFNQAEWPSLWINKPVNNRITIRIESDVDEALKRVISSELTTAKSKQDAFRHIVRDWLTLKGYLAHVTDTAQITLPSETAGTPHPSAEQQSS
jgi:hypothetical protein